MQFDDRLATVLRMRAGSDGVLRTQFRQLLDLLGTSQEGEESALRGEAYARLGEIMESLPQEEQARILREPGLRLRNPGLVSYLAEGEAKPAASAMATARLTEDQWLALIPVLPVTARGFLRHRRDLPGKVRDLLARLGVQDLVLPDPGLVLTEELEIIEEAVTATPVAEGAEPKEGIGALLRRIEAFREGRQSRPMSPRLPLEEEIGAQEPLIGFEFATDASGMVTWASGSTAAFAYGMLLTAPRPGTLVELAKGTAARFAARQPVDAAAISIDAAPEISGEWRMEAAPIFDRINGSFAGYRGCLRRPVKPEEDTAAPDSEGDVMRQVLHELRTPVNAIQGFAEIIQQQLFGPAPHEYRAHAAAISVDSAKLLAGFDEVDRLVKLNAGAMELEEGETDMRVVVSETVQRLQGVLRPRNAGFKLRVKGSPFLVGLERREAMSLCWRLLATAAGAVAPGEEIAVTLRANEERVRLRMRVPRSLTEAPGGALKENGEVRQRAVTAGMFGPNFSFRLAKAEASAAGGKLKCKKDRVTLTLPALTTDSRGNSSDTGRKSG